MTQFTMTDEHAAKLQALMMETVKQLVHCLEENQTSPLIGEMALAMLAGTSAGVGQRSLDDVILPTLRIGWNTANEYVRKGMN